MMKGWQSKGVIGQISHESNYKHASWEENEGNGAYKRRGCAIRREVQKNLREKTERRTKEGRK